jgi:hypothetical protein
MDITKELKDTIERRARTLDRLNQLKAEEQQVLHELLRLDGEIRFAERLSRNGEKPKPE